MLDCDVVISSAVFFKEAPSLIRGLLLLLQEDEEEGILLSVVGVCGCCC